MSDTAAWCVAVILVGAGVAADGYLVWMFIRDARAIRPKERVRRTSCHFASKGIDRFPSRYRSPALAALAAVGMTAAVASAQTTAMQPGNVAPPESSSTHAVVGGRAEEISLVAPTTGTPSVDAARSAISLQLGLDFTSAYFYRGIRQQDKGLIVQPTLRLTTRLVDDADSTLDGFIGTWNSFGPNGGTRNDALEEDWYESDLYAGFTYAHGKLSLTTSYTFLTSPSDAFQTVQELGFTLTLDDSEWLRAWALKPYATLAIETGSNGSDGPDLDNGTYLELGIAPGFSIDVCRTTVTLSFPVSLGLSVSDYYQATGGAGDDTFGFAQIGAKAAIPLGEPGRFGTWTLNAGVTVLFLGDNAKASNNGNGTQVIGTVGLQWNF